MNARKVNKILVSQPKPSSDRSPYFEIADKYQVELQFRQLIKVERVSSKEFRQQRIRILDFSGIVLTSRTAVDHLFSLCEELKVIMPDSMKYFCISETVALYLQKYIVYRKRKIFFSQTGKIDGLNNAFTKHSKEKLLFPVPEEHNSKVSQYLTEKKLDFTESVMYRTVSDDFKPGEKLDTDMIIFFSPLGVAALKKNFPYLKQGDMAIGCFGANTAKAVEDEGFRLDFCAPQPEYPSVTAALDAFLEENHKKHQK